MRPINPLAIYEPGQRVREPTKPLTGYPEYHARTLPWLAMAKEAEETARRLGPEAALATFNKTLGMDLFLSSQRYLPQLSRFVTLGFLLVPGGCQWALKDPRDGMKKAGCTFCEFQEIIDEVVGGLRIGEEELNALATAAMSAFGSTASIVRYFTGGSGLNPGEIPVGSMHALARLVAAAPETEILGVESRVQFINQDTISQYAEILYPAGKSLEVMIGFETQDDAIRNGPLLNKGMTRVGFEQATAAVLKMKARPAAYAILMPVNMTEREAVEECLKTCRYLANTGTAEIMLQARYSHHPEIACPTLWSIAHVLWETRHLGVPVTLGEWRGELPRPKVWPRNCGKCDDTMLGILDCWRATLDPMVVDPRRLPSCDCRKPWEESLGL
jgi:radical SAM enzyme (TIGR01210 family)